LALHLVERGGKLRGRDAARAKTEPAPELGIGDPPEVLTAEQRAVWSRLAEDSAPGLLARCDRDAFENLVVVIAARDALVAKFNQSGGHVLAEGRDPRGHQVTSVTWRELRRLIEMQRVLSSDFGYSPVSRTRVCIPRAPDDDDPLGRFLS
jgi:P27 family predicted phage terminase small subunit